MEQQFNKEPLTTGRPQTGAQQGEEAQINAVVDGVSNAFRAKDLEKIMSFYADDIVAFDMVPPLEFNGKGAYRKSWKMGLDAMSEVGEFESAHKKIHVSGDLAILHCLYHMTGKLKADNQKIDMWSRYTGAFRKTNGKWLIIHEQLSVPIDMDSEKPIWNLKPDTGPVH